MSISSDPYVIVNFNLPPGKQITTTVRFVVGTANPISYGLVVLAGGQLP
jgi:hypothetical protein